MRRFLVLVTVAIVGCGGVEIADTPTTPATTAASTTTTTSMATSTTTGVTTTTTTAATIPIEACPPVELRPLTLPWATGVSEPDYDTTTPEGASVVGWEGPPYSQTNEGPVLSVVEIQRGVQRFDEVLKLVQSVTSDADQVHIIGWVRGHQAVLLGLDGTDVEASWLYWKEGSDRCDEYGLRVSPHSSTIWNLLPQITPDDQWTVWPEWTPHQSALASRLVHEEQPWRRDLEATATRFGQDVFDWAEVLIETTHEEWEHAEVTLRRAPDHAGIGVSFRRSIGNEYWAVAGAWTLLSENDGCALSVGVWEDQAAIGFLDRGAAQAEVSVGYGSETASRTVAPRSVEVVEFTMDFGRDEPGFVSVLLRDADGSVFDAVIAALPPGDFAAC